jgi:hypothetical protein
MDLEVVIEGVSDARVAQEIKRRIQEICRDVERGGEWTVTLSPAETRGQWDLGVRGPFGRRFASFADRPGGLPDLVAEQLRTCLDSDLRPQSIGGR